MLQWCAQSIKQESVSVSLVAWVFLFAFFWYNTNMLKKRNFMRLLWEARFWSCGRVVEGARLVTWWSGFRVHLRPHKDNLTANLHRFSLWSITMKISDSVHIQIRYGTIRKTARPATNNMAKCSQERHKRNERNMGRSFTTSSRRSSMGKNY